MFSCKFLSFVCVWVWNTNNYCMWVNIIGFDPMSVNFDVNKSYSSNFCNALMNLKPCIHCWRPDQFSCSQEAEAIYLAANYGITLVLYVYWLYNRPVYCLPFYDNYNCNLINWQFWVVLKISFQSSYDYSVPSCWSFRQWNIMLFSPFSSPCCLIRILESKNMQQNSSLLSKEEDSFEWPQLMDKEKKILLQLTLTG